MSGRHFIRAWRQARGLTLRQLADLLSDADGDPALSHASIGRIETGKQAYTQPALETLAQALRVTPAELLGTDPATVDETERLVRAIAARGDPTAVRVLRALADPTPEQEPDHAR